MLCIARPVQPDLAHELVVFCEGEDEWDVCGSRVQSRREEAPLEVGYLAALLAGDAVPYAVDAVFLLGGGYRAREEEVPYALVVGIIVCAKVQACVDGQAGVLAVQVEFLVDIVVGAESVVYESLEEWQCQQIIHDAHNRGEGEKGGAGYTNLLEIYPKNLGKQFEFG